MTLTSLILSENVSGRAATPYKDRRVCLFNDPLSLKVAQSSGSDMFGQGECFGDDIIYRWVVRGRRTAVYFYCCEIVHVQCS